MAEQFDLFAAPAVPAPPTYPLRRLDITLENLRAIVEGLSEEESITLSQNPYWPNIELIFHLRAMERAEEEVRGFALKSMADTYDHIIAPGEPMLPALSRLLQAIFTRESL
jgi:hypothetical protein